MTILRLPAMAVCLGWCVASDVRGAELWNVDDPHFGANALTVDGRTGLRWLNLSLSRGFSYDQMQVEIQPGGQFYGFRSATSSEVESLLDSAGIINGAWYPSDGPGVDSIREFVRLIGPTLDGTNPQAVGIAGDGPYPGVRFVPNLNFYVANGVPGYQVSCPPIPTLMYGDSTAFDSVGNWLVAVPEPATGTLLLLSCILLGVKRGRRPGRIQ